MNIILKSDSCLDIFPENQGNNFSNLLLQSFEASGLEIALIDVFFSARKARKLYSNCSNLKDSKIIFTSGVSSLENLQLPHRLNYSTTIMDWISYTNIYFKNQNISITLAGMMDIYGKVTSVRIANEYKKYDSILLHKNLVKCLGFSKVEFVIGNHESTQEPLEEEFKYLKDEFIMNLINKRQVKELYLPLDQEYSHPLDLITDINLMLKENNINIIFSTSDESTKVLLKHKKPFIFKMSATLNQLFGQNPEFEISDDQKDDEVYLKPPNLEFGNQCYLFLCNAIYAQIFASKMIPVMRITKQNFTNTTSEYLHVKYDPIYLPMKPGICNLIQFQVINESFEFASVDGQPSIVQLHVRKIK